MDKAETMETIQPGIQQPEAWSGMANLYGQTKIDYLNVKKAALVLRALNHKLRQQMIKLLDENGKMTVTELYVQLRLEQSVASQHLAILRRAGIVKTDRDGKYIHYRVNQERVRQINQIVESLIG